MLVLGLETSCDETGVALYDSERGLLADALFSQIDLHRAYGGVVPELASRDHVKRMLPLIRQVLAEADCVATEIDAIAYTAGPGLVGALLVGASCAQALAFAWGIPALGVHHMEGHLLAPMLEPKPPEFPFVALLVSGGHTQLVQVDGIGQYALLGETLDDAAGEAFDKTAKMMGLNYPGGPEIARLAAQGVAGRFVFPRPMCDRPWTGCRRRAGRATRALPRRSSAAGPRVVMVRYGSGLSCPRMGWTVRQWRRPWPPSMATGPKRRATSSAAVSVQSAGSNRRRPARSHKRHWISSMTLCSTTTAKKRKTCFRLYTAAPKPVQNA